MARSRRFRRWINGFFGKFSANKKVPKEFLCPISNSLMFDPTVVASGETFEHHCVEVCRELCFTPTLPDGSSPNFSKAIPNLALRTAIHNWCLKSGIDSPKPPLYSEIESAVRSLAAIAKDQNTSKIRVSETLLLNRVSDRPPILLSHAASDLNTRTVFGFDCSTSDEESEESVIVNTTPPFPFATRPACFSGSSTSSISPEFSDNASSNYFSAASSISPSEDEDEDLVAQMNSLDVYEKEQAVIMLRKTTKSDEDSRILLCTDRILTALKELLNSRYTAVQSNAAAAAVNLSLEKCNKIRMVRSGIIPSLIEVLKNGFEESREHAAGAIFSLAIEDENKTVIGVLGALEPLLRLLRSGSLRGRRDAALALYHLTLVQGNRTRISGLGAAPILLELLKDGDMAGVVSMVICNLAACGDGKTALLDADAVHFLLEVLRDRNESYSETTRENCVAALHSLSHGKSRFRAQARGGGAVEVLRGVVERGSERSRENAKRILEGLRRPEASDGEEVDWEAVMKGDLSQFRYRVGSRFSSGF